MLTLLVLTLLVLREAFLLLPSLASDRSLDLGW